MRRRRTLRNRRREFSKINWRGASTKFQRRVHLCYCVPLHEGKVCRTQSLLPRAYLRFLYKLCVIALHLNNSLVAKMRKNNTKITNAWQIIHQRNGPKLA